MKRNTDQTLIVPVLIKAAGDILILSNAPDRSDGCAVTLISNLLLMIRLNCSISSLYKMKSPYLYPATLLRVLRSSFHN